MQQVCNLLATKVMYGKPTQAQDDFHDPVSEIQQHRPTNPQSTETSLLNGVMKYLLEDGLVEQQAE